MNQIKIETSATIIEGEEEGCIYIQNDAENTGGFLFLVTSPSQSIHAHGYDNWVENLPALQEYFQEARWKVLWKENP